MLCFSLSLFEKCLQQRDLERGQLVPNSSRPGLSGPSTLGKPNKLLYLSPEQPTNSFGEPDVALPGRVGGELFRTVGVQIVLYTLALSWTDAEVYTYPFRPAGEPHRKDDSANGQRPDGQVFNVPASVYASCGHTPRCERSQDPQCYKYVQVPGNTPWVIFLAGQSSEFFQVTHGCPACAVNAGSDCVSTTSGRLRILIGYQ